MSVAEYPDVARERSAPFPGYRAGRPARTAAGKLSSNEAALGPAPAVLGAITTVAGEAHLYLPGWLRVSVGAPPAMARLRAVLKEVL